MRASPPARRIGRVTAVRRPGIGFVFVQTVKASDIFGVTDGFESAHVFPAGKDVRALLCAVDPHHGPNGQFLFIQLLPLQDRSKRRREITPDERDVRDLFDDPDRHGFCLKDLKAFF